MAKLKVRAGESEVEIDSRDFYVDNDTVAEVIDLVRTHLPEPCPAGAGEAVPAGALDSLEEAEVPEPELPDGGPAAEGAPVALARREDIRRNISALRDAGFFEEQRTASETLERLRERGWTASILDVSKELARMSSERLIRVHSHDRRNYYSVPLAR